jgi:sulfite dehydrogenase (quinone) subunit SoeC
MKPAFSVIFFTVGSGAGLGLFSLLVLADVFGQVIPEPQALVFGGVAIVLTALGFMSSLFHLANPKNAWRAVSRFATSWLSREGIFGLLFFPAAVAYLGMDWLQVAPGLRMTAGLLALVIAWATLYSTGMIYGCLRTIPQWHTPLVPALYLVLAHSSGALLFGFLLAALGLQRPGYLVIAQGLLAGGALLKAIYYIWMSRPGPGSSLNTATSLDRGPVRLLDAGHSHGNFVTEEFGFVLARENATLLKGAVFALGFLVPAGLLLFGGVLGTGAAVAFGLAGLVVERWLFFAEARHVVRLLFSVNPIEVRDTREQARRPPFLDGRVLCRVSSPSACAPS